MSFVFLIRKQQQKWLKGNAIKIFESDFDSDREEGSLLFKCSLILLVVECLSLIISLDGSGNMITI